MKQEVTEYVQRTAPVVRTPKYAVTAVFKLGNGEDVAWFFKKKDMLDYIKFKNGQVGLRRS